MRLRERGFGVCSLQEFFHFSVQHVGSFMFLLLFLFWQKSHSLEDVTKTSSLFG